MKNKPVRHKEKNIFKFKRFSDRITEVDIRKSALYHIDNPNKEELSDNETQFHITYQKWMGLNLTEEFNTFQRNISKIVTLPQLIHKKDFVVEHLKKFIETATNLSLQPLLEFVIALAKDLREVFYPYFQKFLNILIKLLDTKDPDQLEWTLICLACLFKTLKPFLKKEISIVFEQILPLLNDKNPIHITNFAAECFSFVTRDIRDKEQFLGIILKQLKKYPNGIVGCGRLLFEIIHGVNGKFHSCTEEFLKFLFESFSSNKYDHTILFDVLTQMITDIVECIETEQMSIFWKIILIVLANFKNEFIQNKNEKPIEYLLKLVGQVVESRGGKNISNPLELNDELAKIMDLDVTENLALVTSQICTVMLLSESMNLTQFDSTKLCRQILSTEHKLVFENFVSDTVNYSQFEYIIFPEFIKYFDQYYDKNCLELMCKIILAKSKICISGVDVKEWKRMSIKLKSRNNSFPKIEESVLKVGSVDGVLEHFDEFIMATIVYSHIHDGHTKKEFIDEVQSLVEDIIAFIVLEDEPIDGKEIEEYINNKKIFFLLSVLVEVLIHENQKINTVDRLVDVLLPYCNNFKYVNVLRILDLLLTSHADNDFINLDLFNKIHKIVSENLYSPYHEVRVLTAHLLSLFKNCFMISEKFIYEYIYEVENIIPTVHNYRDVIQIFDKFNYTCNYYQNNVKEMEMYRFDGLKYLFGTLYINFRLLWEPTSKIIITYSEHVNELWDIIKPCLTYCDNEISKLGLDKSEEIENSIQNSLIKDIFDSCWSITNKPDFLNYRVLLLNIISNCNNLPEVKNRELIPFYLRFIEEEYQKSEDELKLSINITKQEIKEDDKDESMVLSKPTKRYRIGVQRTLISYLTLFSKMDNPKQLYKEPRLTDLYFEFLTHKTFEVQKIALDCLVKYKHKYINSYKEHLYNLINEKTFKDEISSFKIDIESNVINENDREKFIPILFKILHSKIGLKMYSKKDSVNLRNTLILRFISNCTENEILLFSKLCLKIFSNFEFEQTDNLNDSITEIENNIILENYPHPKKIQAGLNLLQNIREELAGLMSDGFIGYIINLLFGIGTTINSALNKNVELSYIIMANNLSLLKNLKNISLNIFIEIFDQFDKYPWNEDQIDVLYRIFIWDYLEKLPTDSIHTATPLLKLFIEFSKNPRYHVLLAKYKSDNPDLTPLPFLIKLLLNPSTSSIVCRNIMEIIENLLSLQNDGLTETIEITNKIPITSKGKLNYGSSILLPFIPSILEKIKINLLKSRSRYLNRNDISILSRVTELVTDSETSNKLITLILPIIVKKSLTTQSAGDEIITQMLTTLLNLIKQVDDPEKHVRFIAPLFEQINDITARKILCQIITHISTKYENNDSLSVLSEIVIGLNALDQRWLEQPDYEIRLDTFKKITNLTKSNAVDVNLCLIVVYHCFYYLKYDKDLAIRDSAGYHLKTIVPSVVIKYSKTDPKEVEFLVGNIILNLVRRTISSKNDSIRNEGILLLGELARECPKCHPVLKDLHPLTDKSDRELDFFDNITHLQSHRHGRGLLKFCQISKTYEVLPNPRTLTQFILPLASLYLCNETYSLKHGIVEAAIQTVGSVARLLPWFQYEAILKYYLKKLRYNLEYQKQLVRLVMSILDSFHFDLSKANVIPTDLPKLEDIEDESFAKILKPQKRVDDPENEEETLDNVLETIDDKPDIDEDFVKIDTPKKTSSASEKLTILSANAAKRLIDTISRGILPALNNAIVKLTIHDQSHKINRKKRKQETEDEDTLRVPIALAIVKLLQKLPDGMLDHNLPGIFMKVGTFLKSHLKSIRMLARDVLRKIMLTVGTSRLEILLNHLSALLTRGFQCHVLSVTVHNVLDALKAEFKPGEIDKNLKSILKVCLEDIFGKTSEEKEVEKLGINTPEAKPSNKSYMILNIVALNITESCLLDLIVPFKNHLDKSQSKKVVNKVQESFQKILSGLIENRNISVEALMIFIYGITSKSITDLLPKQPKQSLSISEKELLQRQRPDIFLIPEAPRSRSSGIVKKLVKTNSAANAHILIEFGLDLLHTLLKKKKYDFDCVPYLDPMIPIFEQSLESAHVRVSTYALKCLVIIWNQKCSIPSLESNIVPIVEQIFKILHKYSTVGMSTNDDNYHLVKNIFKGMMAILRYVEYYTITEDQLKILLLYVEQDLHSTEKTQSFAFSLLKAILSKKLQVPEMHDVMGKICEISVLSESNTIREETRTIFLSYLMNYPLGKKVDSHLKFFVNQLQFELITGRQSAIQMLSGIIKKFPLAVLKDHSGFLFLSLGIRLVNDDVAECRIAVAETIEQLLTRLEKNDRDELFEITVLLLNDTKSSHREVAAQLIIRFVNVEKNQFEIRLKKLFPLLISKLTFNETCGKFVKINRDSSSSEEEEEENESDNDDSRNEKNIKTQEIKKTSKQKSKDHQLIQLQNAIIKIFEICRNVLIESDYSEYIDEIAYHSQKLLGYEHVWVRLNSTKILDFILSTTDFHPIEKRLLNDDITCMSNRVFIYSNPNSDLKSLVLDHCAQLFPGETDEEMANQIMKNLLYIANFLKHIPIQKKSENMNPGVINISWLIRKIRFVIHSEVAKSPHSIILRAACFNWITGILSLLELETIKTISIAILTPLVREMSEEDTTVDPKLRQIAVKVGNKIKKKIGDDDYNILRSKIQSKFMIKRAERKKVIAQEKINDPERAGKRRIGIQNRKKESKRRRMDVLRGNALPKRKKRKLDDFEF